MPLTEQIQNIIHKIEVGAGQRYLRNLVLALFVLGLAVIYDVRAYRNLAAPEAMDAAQVARNLSRGNGFSTLFIRPLSVHLIQSHNQPQFAASVLDTNADYARIKHGMHPDLQNPPVYPLVLAGLMKVLPFDYKAETTKPFWSNNGFFWRYQPDFLITLFNQVLLLGVAVLIFLIARRLFDSTVAWLTALLVVGCELLWRFSASGLPTLLLMIIFLGLTWCLLKIELAVREPATSRIPVFWLALIAGAIVGVGALTRYSFGWLIIPVMLFLALFSGPRRIWNLLAALAIFLVLLSPWVVRNLTVSGTMFGTAGFAVAEGTSSYPDFQLQRSLHPDLSSMFWLKPYLAKCVANMRDILANGLPKLGGSWASVLFLAGLLLGFRGLAVRRMRYFLLMCFGVLIVVQALGKTALSDETPDVNSENLLVILVPLVFMYGASFFLIFLDQMKLPLLQLRYAIMVAFVGVCSLPLIFSLLPPRTVPVVYPPYYPPDIQQVSNWMRENELMMSDVPWSVAWYGQRQCLWLTLDAQDEFYAFNDYEKNIRGLYLTPKTTDSRLVSDGLRLGMQSWGGFVIQATVQRQAPANFTLHYAPTNFMPERVFLTDWERWKKVP